MSNGNLDLRPATNGDVTQLKAWLSDSTDCTYAIDHFPLTTGDFLNWLSADDQFGWVMQLDGNPVGYGEVWVDAKERDTELAHIVIAPQYRRRGLGQALTKLLYHKACTWNYSFVYMRLYPENQQALTCYQAVGFQVMDTSQSSLPSEWLWLRRACQSEI